MKNLFRVPFAMLMASMIFVACSKEENTLPNENSFVNLEQQNEYVTQASPWPIVVAVIKILSDVSDGRYYKRTTYENGQPTEVIETCIGTFGTCTFNGQKHVEGEGYTGPSITINSVQIEESDTEPYSIHAELQNSDLGVLYAINYIEYPEEAAMFFNSESKTITGQVIIDNPEVLEEIGVDPESPITINGDYQVYQTDEYKYIIID